MSTRTSISLSCPTSPRAAEPKRMMRSEWATSTMRRTMLARTNLLASQRRLRVEPRDLRGRQRRVGVPPHVGGKHQLDRSFPMAYIILAAPTLPKAADEQATVP